MEIIAEVGSNFKTLGDCLKSVCLAKAAGATAVKFQLYTHKDLYGVDGTIAGELPRKWIPQIAAVARRENIEFMCTGFSPDGYRYLDPFVARHKVASSEITAIDILEAVNGFGKPVLLSTGGATYDEIAAALMILRNVPVTIMYCVVDYPARIVDMRMLEAQRRRFGTGCLYGYSDHSTDVLNIPLLARSNGAVVLEKHVNFTEHADTPDAPHSLSSEEFALMVKHLKSRAAIYETFIPNPWKRKMITLPDGTRGYFRPLPDAG